MDTQQQPEGRSAGDPAQADQDAPDRPPSAGPSITLLSAGDRHQHNHFSQDHLSHNHLSQDLLPKLAAALAPARGEVRVKLVGDQRMADAHQRYKKAAGTTDVLTFDLSDTPSELDADLLVCTDEAKRNADARGIPIEHELLLYITHGILHCLGYNDDTDHNAQRMHDREDQLLTAIGVGPVFSVLSEPASEPES